MSLFHQLPVDHCHSAATQQSGGLLVIVGNSVPIWYLFKSVYFSFMLFHIQIIFDIESAQDHIIVNF